MSTVTRPAPGEVWRHKYGWGRYMVVKVCETDEPPRVLVYWGDEECHPESYVLTAFLMYFERVNSDADH